MGQQQLLLLVLSTVIVGLATVAGIQAFSENQAQASQDALVQRGTSIASDIQGLYGKPTQMGGVNDFTASSVTGESIANRLGYEVTGTSSGTATVSAEGAGTGGSCDISTGSTGTNGSVDIECTSDDASQTVTVTYDPDDNDGDGNVVATSFSSS
ncbi:hypothetical protein [Salinibacter ruber]|jgi:hypothetical protein|uniref:hypothetical protein n=1 Tax=Salinibacter ruber TaxID=146919 RepID=UPI002169849C|nr:hypothetical protein [Salinibacter ruber]MCS4038987.1 hypothetical protein [Salinibacter ruber]